MKNKILFFLITINCCLNAQPLQEYFFNNNFNGTLGGGPLTQLLSCGAALGSFGTQSVTTSAGFCSNSTAFCFNAGGGLSYPNTSITSAYSINVFCKFSALSGYTRVIDFSNGTSDNGMYLLNNCLVLYPTGYVGPCPYFNPNVYYLFTFIRDGVTNVISVYVNGIFFASYLDSGNLYRPATSTSPIVFFRDDNVAPCESQAGCISYASVSSSTLSAAQVNTVWLNICNTVSTCTATAGSSASVCPGQSATIGGTPTAVGGSGTFTYSWTPSTGLNNASIANPVATPTVQTKYTVTINDGIGCVRNDSVRIYINPLPTVTISPSSTICPATSKTLTAGGAVSYTWSPSASLSSANGFSVIASPSSTTIYTVTGKNAGGCIKSATVQITMGTNPVITISPNSTICPVGSATLTASGATSYTWSPSATLSSANGVSVTASPVATTVYTVSGKNASGCLGTNTVQVAVTVNPIITISPNATICPAGSATLSTSGANSYTWSPSATLSSANGVSVTATPAATTIYTVTGTNASGCTGTSTVQVLVDVNPALTVSPNSTICPASSATLLVSGTTSYTWSPSATLSSANGASVAASPLATTVYTVTGKNANGCVGTATTQVFVTVNPSLTISSNATICPAGSTILSTSGANSYTWSPSSTLSSASGATVTASPLATTVYTVTGSNANGCTGTSTVQVLVDVNPSLTASPNATICPVGSATLSISGANSYTWSPSSTLSSASGPTVTASPLATTVYTVIGSNANGCIGTSTVQVLVDINPSLTISPNATVCPAGSATLTASGAMSYTWSPSATLSSANGASVTASPPATTVYTVIGSNVNGCIGTSTVQVLVDVNPSLIISPNATICPAGSITLTASGATSYTWSPSVTLSSANGASVAASPVATTVYSVTGKNASGCIGTSSVQVLVDVNPSLMISSNTTVCPAGSSTLAASGAASYTWSPSATLSSANGTSVVATPFATTVYSVTGTNTNGCIGTNTVQVSLNTIPTITGSPNTTICATTNTILTASGAVSYTWSPSAGLSSVNGASVTATPTALTIYTVTGANASGCTGTQIISVSVANNPTITAVGATFCASSSATLAASGATSYTWSPSASLNTTTAATVIATPSANTTYTVVGASGACTASAIATASLVVVNPTLTATSSTYCIGGASVTLTGSGASTYSWSPAFGLSATSGAIVSASPTVTTTYTLTGFTGVCNASQTISINVPPITSLSIVAGSTLICPNGSGTTLTASGGGTYTWSPVAQTTSTLHVNPLNTTTYTVVGQSAAGCIALSAVVSVSVSTPINPVLSISSPSVCLTKTVTISTTPIGSIYSYTWLPVASIQGSNAGSAITAKPTSTATVIYTVSISNGLCKETNTISLQVFNCIPPVSHFSTLTNDTICTKACVSFTATSTGIQPFTYQWLFPGGTPATSTLSNPVVCYNLSGNYPVYLITGNTFGSDTLLLTNYINVTDTPSVRAYGDTLISVGQTAPIRVTGSGTTYYWSQDNGTIVCVTCTNTVVQPTVTTQYIVTAYNSPYCKKQDAVLVKVDFVCGDFFIPNAFSPNGDGLNDELNIHGFCITTYTLKIFNRWGEVVFETSDKSFGWDGTFRGKALDTGVFVYSVEGITIERKPFSKKGNITLLR